MLVSAAWVTGTEGVREASAAEASRVACVQMAALEQGWASVTDDPDSDGAAVETASSTFRASEIQLAGSSSGEVRTAIIGMIRSSPKKMNLILEPEYFPTWNAYRTAGVRAAAACGRVDAPVVLGDTPVPHHQLWSESNQGTSGTRGQIDSLGEPVAGAL